MKRRKIYIQDMHALDICSRGIRVWFSDRNLDYMDFVQNGISYNKLARYKDCGFCKQVLDSIDEVEDNGK